MRDQELENALRRRADQVPDGAAAAAAALETLGLDGSVCAGRNPWTLVAAAAPVLTACVVIYLVERESIQTFGARAAQAGPAMLRAVATAWRQFSTGLAPGLVVACVATLMAGCLFASWRAGSPSARASRNA